MMRIATWNINSIRARQERLLTWLEAQRLDVLCLQEIKVTAEQFPSAALESAGYHVAVVGQKTYNGVAVLARRPFDDVSVGLADGADDAQARLLSVELAGLRILSLYVPNGGNVGSEKWSYKLAWLERLRDYLERRHAPGEPLLLCGDFNVAPDDRDVARPESWRDTVLTHAEARQRLRRVTEWGLVDLFREAHPDGGIYSWWDYRQLGFPRNNGLRLDLILATRPVAQRSTRTWIDRDARKGKQPSDHAPVLLELSEQ